MSREPISKKLRFQVLTRDRFCCRYCGAKAGDAKLHIDHRVPVSKGGRGTIENLYTACQPCNLGKGVMDVEDVPIPHIVMLQIKLLEGMALMLTHREMPVDWVSLYVKAYERGECLEAARQALLQDRDEQQFDMEYAFGGRHPKLEKPSDMKLQQQWVNEPSWRANMSQEQVDYIRQWRPN